jgi:hypothetical protein
MCLQPRFYIVIIKLMEVFRGNAHRFTFLEGNIDSRHRYNWGPVTRYRRRKTKIRTIKTITTKRLSPVL